MSTLTVLFALGGLTLTAFLVLFMVELIDTYRRRWRSNATDRPR